MERFEKGFSPSEPDPRDFISRWVSIALRVAFVLSLTIPFVPSPSLAVSKCPVVPVVFVKKPPKLDGDLSDKAWRRAFRVTDFHVYAREKDDVTRTAPKHPTAMMLVYTPEALYLAFDFIKRVESGKSIPYLARVTGGDSECYRDDSIDVFLQPDVASNRLYQFITNLLGGTYEGAGTRTAWNDSWNGCWTPKARKTPTGWAVEMEIPFATLDGATPADGAVWGFSPVRKEYALNEKSHWANVAKDWYDVVRFGRCKFIRDVPQDLTAQIVGTHD